MKLTVKTTAIALTASLTLIACGKQVSVKDDWTKYQLNASKIQQEMQTKQNDIQQQLQKSVMDPAQTAVILAEEDKLIAETKARMSKLDPDTDLVKKVNKKNIEVLDRTSAMMKAMPEAVKVQSAAPIQEAQKAFMSTVGELQAAQAEVLNAIK